MKKNRIKGAIIGAIVLVGLSVYFLSNMSDYSGGFVGTAGSDSLYKALDKLPVGKYEMATAREQIKAYYSGDTDKYARVTTYFEKRAEKDNNRVARSYIKSNKASILLLENKPDSALIVAKDAEKEVEGTNAISLGNIYNTLGNANYHLGNQDSAKTYMTKGYLFATTQKIDIYISTFGINLGTYYYDHLLYGAASYYFNVALEASKRQDNTPLMLINNITSILAAQHKFKEADSLWNIYIDEMEKEDDPYSHQLFFLNRILHLQNMDRWKEARKVYSEFKPDEIYDVLRVHYLRAMLNQMIKENPSEAIALVQKHSDWIGVNYVPAVSELFPHLHILIDRNPSILPMDTLLQWEKNFAVELKDNPKAASHSNKLKSLIAYKRGNTVLAYQLLEKSRVYDVAFDEISDSLRYADFSEKNQLSKLKEDISIANLKVEQTQKEKTYVKYLWILSLGILISFIIALLFALSYRKTKLDYALDQISFIKAEENYLLKEQELNSRIVNLSQLIVIKAQDLGKKIKLISSEDKETLQDVKREIEELSRLGIEDKPQLADKLIDNHQTIFERFPDFAETANLTEKRIFILSIDGYKPKEIANVVGVSVQYVHNVRTRLRKKLDIDNSVEWESLKKGGIAAEVTSELSRT
ncbi:MAG: hypothetical protein V4590_13000 [Bacteroidota bacterium]